MPSSICKTLHELPTTLDDTYERALGGIPKEKRQHAHRLFQCLVAAIRPLRAEELAEIFAIDFGGDATSFVDDWRPENAEEAVLSTCSTLISIIKDEGSKIVQFSHFSVKEFLTSDRLRESEVRDIRYYHVALDAAHTVLARACLTVLLGLDENVDTKHLKGLLLAFYAAQNWVNHARYEDVATRVQDAMQELFNPAKRYLTSWVWIHDIDRDWDRRTIDDLTLCPPRSPPRATALYYAALCGFSELANYLILSHPEDINVESGTWGAPLHVASRSGNSEVIDLLLQQNADVNVKSTSYYNWTPLHFASTFGHAKLVQLFLDRGADVDAQSSGYNTSLRFATRDGHLEVARLLLLHGANVHIRGDDGLSPFQMAMMKRRVKIAQLLLEYGAENEQVARRGYGYES
jgi:hypothetical protein